MGAPAVWAAGIPVVKGLISGLPLAQLSPEEEVSLTMCVSPEANCLLDQALSTPPLTQDLAELSKLS